MDPEKLPQVQPVGPPEAIPVYNCRVYLARQANGKVRARVANLAGMQIEADDERTALRQLVAIFKQHVATLPTPDQQPDWIDPPLEREPAESERWIPVHR